MSAATAFDAFQKLLAEQSIAPAHAEATSIPVAAALCGISRATLYELIKEKRGPKVVKVGRRSLVRRDDRQKWLASLA